MPSLADILDDPELNGVYRVTGNAPELPELVRLDARTLSEAPALLRAIGAALAFPDYYGGNWDALEECLFDLTWWEGPIQLWLDHAEALDAEVLETLIDIWGEVAEEWGREGRCCGLFLAGVGDAALESAES